MFTGLIEDIGTVHALQRQGAGARLAVATALPLGEVRLGDSIAVNGACLTVVDIGTRVFTADVSPETLTCTTLGELRSGMTVNLERALRLGDRLGGHLVSGHVDGVATIAARRRDHNAIRFSFELSHDVLRYLATKGSVAIDGISLTVNALFPSKFEVAIIPHTLDRTTLAERHVGDRVNIEIDLIARYIERLCHPTAPEPETSPLDRDFLAKHGFL